MTCVALFRQIFKELESSIQSIMDGFNGTVLAYGQTSSGTPPLDIQLLIGFSHGAHL